MQRSFLSAVENNCMNRDEHFQRLSTNGAASFQKGLGLLTPGPGAPSIASLGWNLLREDLSLPAAVLSQEKLAHNLEWMKQFVAAYGIQIAPHGKTTMAPALFRRQLATGAWGMTLATAHQTAIAHQHGVRRVLMANQLVGRQNMAIISRLLEDSGFEYFCLVDSAEVVRQLGTFFRGRGQRLQVLIELGAANGRAGARDERQVEEVIAALSEWKDSLALRGVEVYEGVLNDEQQIRAFLRRAVDTTQQLAGRNLFAAGPVILSGAGSAWYDVVAETFAKAEINAPLEVVLRPGCYLTTDAGVYRQAQERIMACNPVARQMHTSLQPALRLWAYVQSVPERSKAIIALGRRDAAFDAGLPSPVLHYRPGQTEPLPVPDHWTLTKLMDQHAYMKIGEGDDIRVGDMIGFDISHPCLTFDKWRYLAIVDVDYNVVDVIETYF
jgi:D-serine dehydratase